MAKRRDSGLPPRLALARLAQDEGDPVGGVRDRRLHARQGRTRPARCAAARLLPGQDAALRRTRGLRTRRGQHRRRARARRAKLDTQDPRRLPKAPPLHRPTTWLEPQLVAEVSFSEWTPGGSLRAPVFLRLREDCTRTQRRATGRPLRSGRARGALRRSGAHRFRGHRRRSGGGRGSRAAEEPCQEPGAGRRRARASSSPTSTASTGPRNRRGSRRSPSATSSPTWPASARFMLPHLADRPLTMIRMPEGIHGERFFQKHWAQSLPEFVESVTVFSEQQGRASSLSAGQQSGDPAVARPGRHARVPRLALARLGAAGGARRADRLRRLARGPGSLDPQLSGLPGVRHRPLHLFGQGSQGRRTGTQQDAASRSASASRSGCTSCCRRCPCGRS